jgi:DNA repair protein RadC
MDPQVTENSVQRPPRLRDLPADQWPQERLERLGAAALTDTELIAILLRSGGQDRDVLTVAHHLLLQAGGLRGLIHQSVDDFRGVPGIGRVKALQVSTLMELAKRVLRSDEANLIFNKPQAVLALLEMDAAGLGVEKFWVLCLNRKNRLIKVHAATSGTASSSLVHPREVFREAIRSGACAIICAHNHPSGDPSPSAADIQVTRQLREAAKAVQIDLLDHVILGTASCDPARLGYYSFRDAGLL